MKPTKLLAALAVTSMLASCDFAPALHMPGFGKQEAFKEAANEPALSPEEAGSWKVGQPSAAQPRGEWWHVFNDAKLDALEDDASKNNQNLAAMVARVTQARAIARVAESALLPQIDNTTSATRQKLNPIAFGATPGTSFPAQTLVGTSFGLDYELDLFGGLRNERKAAVKDAEAAAEQLESMKLALQADVADTYFSLEALDREINILERGVTVRTDNLDILHKRVEAGTITELDLSTSVVDLETTRSQLNGARQDRAVMEHALAVLLGKTPADFNFDKSPLTAQIPVIPAGLPSALLERRPDISAAQHEFAAANARIGVAKAAFFPRLSLTATGGLESDTLSNALQWSSRSWAIGPVMSLPIFTGGRNTANLKRSKAVFEEQVAVYRQQVLEAFRDVEDSLVTLKTLGLQSQSQITAADAAKQAEKIANLRYDSGDLGYLETISARRDALETERNGVLIQQARLSATIRLIRALGGGWDAPFVPLPAEVSAPATAGPAADLNESVPPGMMLDDKK